MFRNMLHAHAIQRNIFWDGSRHTGFITDVFIKCPPILPQSHMVVYTNHIIECYHIDTIRKKNIPFNHFTKITPERKTVFPKTTCFATYRYIFPNIYLGKNNTFAFVGATDFTKMQILFVAANNEYYDTYGFFVQDYLLA